MKVICSHCRTGYQLDEARIRTPVAKVRCNRCHYVFTVYRMSAKQQDRSPGGDSGEESSAPAADGNTDKKPDHIIAVSNQKGGVAKTSTCLNLGMSLALLNRKVLLIDFDTQSNLTLSLGYRDTPSFYDALHHPPDQADQIVLKTRYPNLWLLPSNDKLVLLDKKYFDTVNFENILRDQLEPVKDQFDHILIDTPPSVGFFTLNALSAADMAVIPSLCEYLSANGANQVLKIIEMIRARSNPDLQYRVLITMYDEKDTSARVVYSKLMANFRDHSFQTMVPYDAKMKESQIMKLPVIVYDKTSRSGLEYMQLARELLNGARTAARPSAVEKPRSSMAAAM